MIERKVEGPELGLVPAGAQAHDQPAAAGLAAVVVGKLEEMGVREMLR